MNWPRESGKALGSMSNTPGSVVSLDLIMGRLADERIKVLAVAAFSQGRRQPQHLLRVDPSALESDLLGARDHQARSLFQCLHKVRCLGQAIERSRVEPCRPSSQ